MGYLIEMSLFDYSKSYFLPIQAMLDPVMMVGTSLTHGLGKNTTPQMKICTTSYFPTPFIYTSKTKCGKLNVATPELLALDIVAYKNAIGGLP